MQNPRRTSGEPAVYHYIKVRHRHEHEDPVAEEEVLFPLERPSPAPLVLTVKPSSLAQGLVTRLIGDIATGPWDAQPDDVQRLELRADLERTNIIAGLGPSGASLYDLVDTGTLSVVQTLGDAGGLLVRCRDDWCSVASASVQIPFKLDELVARIRPLL